MARPEKNKRICSLPKNNLFYSQNSQDPEDLTIMTLEEYETLRLIDYIGLTQEQCAKQMHVARTTVQRIYTDAKKKVVSFLVNGTALEICGGNYVVCENNDTCCQKFDCEHRSCGCSCSFRTHSAAAVSSKSAACI